MYAFIHTTIKPLTVTDSCRCIPLLQLINCLKSVLSWFQLLYCSMSTCADKHFPCPKILLRVDDVSYPVHPCQNTHCWMLYEQQQMISIRSDVRKWTHIPAVNTACSHLHSFWATGVRSGLAKRVTLTWVSRGDLENLLHGNVSVCDLIFVPLYMILLGLHFKLYSPHNKHYVLKI
jgi:hypothetical protein